MEFLFVVAIILLVLALVLPPAIENYCKAKFKEAIAKIEVCSITLILEREDLLPAVLDCLDAAQKTLDKFCKEHRACCDANKDRLQKAVDEINKKIDTYKLKIEGEAKRDQLEKAKLRVPA